MAFENRNGRIELEFADGIYGFRLAIGELEELQEKTGVGPYALLRRLLANDWRVEDVTQTIRLGLIGDGVKPGDALKLVQRYIEQRSDWVTNSMIAQAIISAAMIGAPEEAPGKELEPEATSEGSNSPTSASPSASYTEPPEPPE